MFNKVPFLRLFASGGRAYNGGMVVKRDLIHDRGAEEALFPLACENVLAE